jgi:hypothetical protein
MKKEIKKSSHFICFIYHGETMKEIFNSDKQKHNHEN